MQLLEFLSDATEPHGLLGALDRLAVSYGAAVLVVDRESNVVWWGGNARREFGLTREQMQGQHCMRALRCSSCLGGCAIQRARGPSRSLESVHRRDGTVSWYQRILVPLCDADDTTMGGIEILVPGSAPIEVDPASALADFPGVVGRDPRLTAALALARRLAASTLHVHVEGEPGTEKLAVATALHRLGPNAAGRFRHLSGGMLRPADFAALGGCASDHEVITALLGGEGPGTVYVEEVSEVPWDVQPLLARLLRPCGPGTCASRGMLPVRLVTTSIREIQREHAAGRVRAELMHALQAARVTLPPLREREGDVERLVAQCVADLNAMTGRDLSGIAPQALELLVAQPWPGNVDELSAALQFAHALCPGPVIRVEDLPAYVRDARPPATPRGAADETAVRREAERIRRALDACDGNVAEAASQLGMSRSTLWRRRRQLGI